MAETPHEFDAENFLNRLTHKPGVYRMINAQEEVIYVGKARDLQKRVSSYFQKTLTHPKTRLMMQQVADVQITTTSNEVEALLLENNLIKQLKPKYNILLRDDKSYPYIYLTSSDDFPRLAFHRGARKGKGEYFGPYPSAGAVRETLNLLQKIFLVRQCEDSFFRNRTRACLQHQIKRCAAPCVGMISKDNYAADVNHARMFLQGKSSQVVDELVEQMEHSSSNLEFERAAYYRDQIASLRRVQDSQTVSTQQGDIDIIAAVMKNGMACVQIFFVRSGLSLGNKSYFPKHVKDETIEQVLNAFIPQFYLSPQRGGFVPPLLLTNTELPDVELIVRGLSQHAGNKVEIKSRVKGDRARWISMAQTNAEISLNYQLSSKTNLLKRFEALQDALHLENLPQRLECFDISHTSGEATVASCVVMDTAGPAKSDYRRFNIEGITGGDDYAAMRQALNRRYTRLKKGEGKIPDVLFIDGGKGQLSEAEKVMQELQIEGVILVGIAKGEKRKPGLETLVLSDNKTTVNLPSNSPALHLIQQVRDEAHRFAVTGHQQRRAKTRSQSVLAGIPGLGPKRCQKLLKQFGGIQELTKAGIQDIAKVQGISAELAQRVYDTLHPDG